MQLVQAFSSLTLFFCYIGKKYFKLKLQFKVFFIEIIMHVDMYSIHFYNTYLNWHFKALFMLRYKQMVKKWWMVPTGTFIYSIILCLMLNAN